MAGDPVQIDITRADHPIKTVWERLLEFSNFAALLIFLAIAFANLLRIEINTYAIKKILPSLIVAIILANFSFLICKILLDVAAAVTGLFLEGNKFLNMWKNCFAANAEGELVNKGLDCGKSVANNYTSLPTDPSQIPEDTTTQFYYLIAGLGKVVGGVMIMILAIMMLLRVYVLYFLIALSPLAFISMAIPATKGVWTRWWKSYWQWVFMLPVASFWLWVGANFFQATSNFNQDTPLITGISIAGYIFGLICVYFAMTTPFKMAGELSSIAGKVQKVAMTATGVYAGQRLAQRGIQGAKQAAGEKIQGFALNKTGYGNIVRLLKQTSAARKADIEKGLSGAPSRGGAWSQAAMDVLSLGASKRSRRFLETNKQEKAILETQAEKLNADDEDLQSRLNILRTKATKKKGDLEQKKSDLESDYYKGKKSKDTEKLLERFNEEESAEYERLKQAGDEKALAEFIEKKLREKAIVRITRDRKDEIQKELENNLIESEKGTEELEQIKKSSLQPLIQQKIKEMKDTGAEAIQGHTDEWIQEFVENLVISDKVVVDELDKQVRATFLKQKESEISQATESQIKTDAEVTKIVNQADARIKESKDKGRWEKITLQYRDQLEGASYWRQTEGKRISEALSGEIDAALGPMMAEKTKGDAVLGFSTEDLRKIDAAIKLKSLRDAGGDITEREAALLSVFSSNTDEAKKLAQEFLDDYARREDYWKLRQNRLKYSFRHPQLLKSAKGFAEGRDAEESLGALKEDEEKNKIKDSEKEANLSGMPEGLEAKNQQIYDRFGMEQDFHLRQNVLNSGFITAINAISKMMSGDQALKVKVIEDKTGRVLGDMGLADAVGRTFMSKFIYRDEERKLATSLKTLIGDSRTDLLKAAEAGSTEVYKWLQKLAEKTNASLSTQERTLHRSLLRDSGYLTLKGIVEGERWDVHGQKQKLIRQADAYQGPDVGENGLSPSITNGSEADNAAATEEPPEVEEGEE